MVGIGKVTFKSLACKAPLQLTRVSPSSFLRTLVALVPPPRCSRAMQDIEDAAEGVDTAGLRAPHTKVVAKK